MADDLKKSLSMPLNDAIVSFFTLKLSKMFHMMHLLGLKGGADSVWGKTGESARGM